MEGKELVQRIFDEVVNKGNLDAAEDLMSEDFVDHGPWATCRGGRPSRAHWDIRAAVPDLHCEVENLILLAWTMRATGTHTGDQLGFAAMGKSFGTVSANLGRMSDGKAAEHWSEQGMFPMLMQLGVLPPIGG